MVFEAFNIISVVEDVSSDLEAAGQISAIESSGSDLFLGTSRGCVLRYQYHVDQSSTTSSVLLIHCSLNNSGAVRCLCLASALEKLVVLTADGCLQTLNAPTLTPADRFQRMRGVSTVALNHNPSTADPLSIQICVARRGQLSVCDVTGAGLRVLSELDVGDAVISVAFSGDVLCVVTAGRYLVLRVNSDVRQQLFDFDPTALSPLVGAFKQGEFVVLGPANLALFASSAGTTERPPLQLTHDPRSWALLPPYLITTDSHTVAYVSLEDETRRGQLSVPGAAHVGNFDGTLFLCVGGSVLSLHTVSTDVQLETLLACGDISAAVSLLDRCDGFDPSPPAARRLGLQLLARGQAAKALQLLLTAGLTPVQMASLVVDCGLPRSADWDGERAALLKLAPALSNADPDVLQSCVTEYLLRTTESVKHEQAVRELALLLLLRRDYDEDTIRRYLLSCSSTSCSSTSCSSASCSIPPLVQHPVERARLLWASGGGGDDAALPCGDATLRDLNRAGAMDLWKDVLEQRVAGDRDAAADHMKRALVSVRGLGLVRQYADVLLQFDQLLGVAVFTGRDSDSQLTAMSVDDVISYLRRHPLALAVYLRHLLDTQPQPSEQVGTQLASLYVDQIARQRHLSDTVATTPSDVTDDVRDRLLRLVRSETRLKCSALLHRTAPLQLDDVSAHLYCRLGEYDKAMELMSTVGGTDSASVSMDRIPGALQFIDEVAPSIPNAAPLVVNTAASLRSRLYSSLLTICLRNADSDATCALHVLNSCDYSCSDLDPVRTLSQLSSHWRLAVLSPFLQSAVRTAVRRQHTARQVRALASCQLTGHQLQLVAHRGTGVCVQQDSVCAVCRGRLSCSDVAVGCEDAAGFGYHDNGTSGDPVMVHPGCVSGGDVPSCSAPSS